MGTIDISDFSGGLNTRDGYGGVADNEIIESINCYLLARGIAKRTGYVRYNGSARIDAANAGIGIYHAPFVGGAGNKVVGVAGDSISYKGTNTWTGITGSVTVTGTEQTIFTMVNNVLVGVNGTDSLWYWTGSANAITLSVENLPTTPSTCESFHGRLFLAKDRCLYWSGYMGDWNTFHPDDFQYFPQKITGLKVYGETNQSILLVFTENSIHQCIFDPETGVNVGGRGTFRFDLISTKHGCISPFSIQECLTPDGNILIIWADADGLKALSGTQIMKLTDKIQPDWDALNPARLDDVVGIYYKPKHWYLLLCSTGSNATNNRVIVYDLRYMSIAGYFDWPISSIGIVRSGGIDYLVGSNYSGYWNTYDSGITDNGVAISAYFRTKSYDGGDPLYDKEFNAVGIHHTYGGVSNFDLRLYYDYLSKAYSTTYTTTAPGTPLGTFVLGIDFLSGVNALVIAAHGITGRGRNVQVRVSNSSLTESFKIYKMQLVYTRGRMVLYR